ncbi:MAG: FapA family protein [Spirochaetales bacterium]|nr:FapA family protein [Spirochaetales bacterium]
MIKLEQLRKYMKSLYDNDKKNKTIQVRGKTLDDALREAAIQLGLPIKKIEYEIIKKGTKKVLGMGGGEWELIAYAAAQDVDGKDIFEEEIAFDMNIRSEYLEQAKNKDGKISVRLQPDGVFLKVTKPVGNGKKATVASAKNLIMRRNIAGYDEALVDKVVRYADNKYVKIANYEYNPAQDPVMLVSIADMEMKAYLVLQSPGPGGADLAAETIKGYLNNNRVMFGIKDDVLKSLEENPVYNEEILVAEGQKQVNGSDAKIVFNFNTDHSTIILKEKNGRVDFKDLNLIENVVAGQQLAKKIPPERGKEGQTVTGKTLPAKPGKNISIGVGKNVKLSEDGTTAISEINGQVILLNGKLNVEPVYTVPGDVNLHTGNILFLGTVIVRGNVEDGFSVKAAGNIEVMGNVGKAMLDAEGDVIVHQGVLGKNEGKVKCGKNIYAKFIEHAYIEAENNVIVTDGILHSYVDSNKKIICQGRRASIVGGRLRAAEEINAKNLGSVAGAETILEVGYDPKSKEKLIELQSQNEVFSKELEEIERNVNTLENLKKVQKALPEEKEKYLTELNEKRMKILSEMKEIKNQIDEIKHHLASLKVKGKISASERVFPGVKIYLKDVMDKVRVEQKSVTYILEGKRIRMTKYEPVEGEFLRRR